MADEQPPTPAELARREEEESARKAREAAEQAQLPYKWTQTIRDVEVTIPVASNIRGRDLDVVLTKTKIRVAIKGQEAFIDVHYPTLQLSYDNTNNSNGEFLGRVPSSSNPRRMLLDP